MSITKLISPNDIPGSLRRLADEVEKEPVKHAIVLVEENDGDTTVYEFGEERGEEANIGTFFRVMVNMS